MDEQIVADPHALLEAFKEIKMRARHMPTDQRSTIQFIIAKRRRIGAIAAQRFAPADIQPAILHRQLVKTERRKHRLLMIAGDEMEGRENVAMGSEIFEHLRRMRAAIDKIAEQDHMGIGLAPFFAIDLDPLEQTNQ